MRRRERVSASQAGFAQSDRRLDWAAVPEPTSNGELQYPPVISAGPVRALVPIRRLLPALPTSGTAVVAAGGFLAGAAALATIRAARGRRWLRRSKKRERRDSSAKRVVATRSFLVDVHLLER